MPRESLRYFHFMVSQLGSGSTLEIMKDQKDSSGFRYQALYPESTRQTLLSFVKKRLCFKKKKKKLKQKTKINQMIKRPRESSPRNEASVWKSSSGFSSSKP